jgi:hypothetical protein
VEHLILLFAYIITIFLLIRFVARHKIREAWVIFSFKQLLTWIFGLLVVQYKLIEYPVRLFSYASRTSFSFEFFIYPAICILFSIYYPFNRGRLRKTMHYIFYTSVITLIEAFLERSTDLIHYIDWTWYWTWITLYITFFMSNKFYAWFFKIKEKI